MIASHDVLTQVDNIRPGINSLVTRVHLVEVIVMYLLLSINTPIVNNTSLSL